MEMIFGIGCMKSLYRAGSLMTVTIELSKYNLDLVGVKEVKLDRGGTEPAGEYTVSCGRENEKHELGTHFLCQI
jgi:hypothetical protein